jgi:hypothetical protein
MPVVLRHKKVHSNPAGPPTESNEQTRECWTPQHLIDKQRCRKSQCYTSLTDEVDLATALQSQLCIDESQLFPQVLSFAPYSHIAGASCRLATALGCHTMR